MSKCSIIDINTRADIARELGPVSKMDKEMEVCRRALPAGAVFGFAGALGIGGAVTLCVSVECNIIQVVLMMIAPGSCIGGSLAMAWVGGGGLLHMKYAKLTDDEKKKILEIERDYLKAMQLLMTKPAVKGKYEKPIEIANQLLDDSATQKS